MIELAVASFLFLIVLGLTSSALTAGVKNYLRTRNEIELQQDAVVILSRISREVGEANAQTTWPAPSINSPLTVPTGNPRGLVFSSPRDGDGRLSLDATTKAPIWQKRVCYYYDEVGQKVYRGEDYLASPSSTAPTSDLTKTTGWFKSNINAKPFPGEVSDFQVEVGESPSSFNFLIEVTSQSLGSRTKVQFLGHATMRG